MKDKPAIPGNGDHPRGACRDSAGWCPALPLKWFRRFAGEGGDSGQAVWRRTCAWRRISPYEIPVVSDCGYRPCEAAP